jgi:F-type H+-transporting ATPase subunit epsilon
VSVFVLELNGATRRERIDGVSSFVGEDDSGQFGLLAGHARLATVLAFGLARFRVGAQAWQFLALPGGVAYFVDDVLRIATRRYLYDQDFRKVSDALEDEFLAQERQIATVRENLQRLEQEMLRRLWEMGRR